MRFGCFHTNGDAEWPRKLLLMSFSLQELVSQRSVSRYQDHPQQPRASIRAGFYLDTDLEQSVSFGIERHQNGITSQGPSRGVTHQQGRRIDSCLLLASGLSMVRHHRLRRQKRLRRAPTASEGHRSAHGRRKPRSMMLRGISMCDQPSDQFQPDESSVQAPISV